MKKSLIPLLCVATMAFAQLTPSPGRYSPPPAGTPSDTSTITGGDLEAGELDGFGEEDDEGLLSSTPQLTTRDTLRTYSLSGSPIHRAAQQGHILYIYKGEKRISQ